MFTCSGLHDTAGYGHITGKKEAKVKSPAIREASMVPDLHHVASSLEALRDNMCDRNYMPCSVRGQAFFRHKSAIV